MIREYKTVRDAAGLWVSQFDAIQQGMIEKLMRIEPDDWAEVTKPCGGDQVYVYELPEELDTLEHGGTIQSYDEESKLYCIKLYSGELISCAEEDFEVERDGSLPMWGTMWSFDDSCDNWWLEEDDGIAVMSRCGFRIYKSEEFGWFFGIDGAGYDFYEAHWEPLYKARGLQWHDKKAEKEYQFTRKGYTKRKLGTREYWFDGDKCIEEV